MVGQHVLELDVRVGDFGIGPVGVGVEDLDELG